MRSMYWDNWKGVAIFAVVLIHASNQTGMFPANSFNNDFGIIIRQFVNFAVALFLFISGFFSYKSSQTQITAFYKSRIPRILYPYLIWTIIYLTLYQLRDGLDLKTILSGFVFGTGIGVGYFVIVLLQLVIITPLLNIIEKPLHHVIIIIMTFAASLTFTYYFQTIQPVSIFSEFPFYALPFFVWLPFYHLGYLLSRYYAGRFTFAFKWWFVSIYFIGVLLSTLEGYFWSETSRPLAVSQLKFSTYLTSLVFCLMVFALRDSSSFMSKRNIWTWIGKNSYPIYLTHILILAIVGKGLSSIPSIYMFSPAYVAISTILVIILCSIMTYSIKSGLPKFINIKALV